VFRARGLEEEVHEGIGSDTNSTHPFHKILHHTMRLDLDFILHHYPVAGLRQFARAMRPLDLHVVPRIIELNVLSVIPIERRAHQALCHVRIRHGLARRLRLAPAFQRGRAGSVRGGAPAQMMRLLDASSPAPQSRISGCFQETSLFPLFRMRTAKPTVAKMGALCVCY
jgi:hypothetical protein